MRDIFVFSDTLSDIFLLNKSTLAQISGFFFCVVLHTCCAVSLSMSVHRIWTAQKQTLTVSHCVHVHISSLTTTTTKIVHQLCIHSTLLFFFFILFSAYQKFTISSYAINNEAETTITAAPKKREKETIEM